jgi:Helix-turn-helix domain
MATAPDRLFTQDELSEDRFNGEVSTATLEKWRCTGEGPPFIKVGRAVLYRESDLEQWLQDRTVTHTRAVLPTPAPSSPSSKRRRR